jgi:hypothetical protein
MSRTLFNPNVVDAFDLFIGASVGRADDLYYLDGETAFRRAGGTIETFDVELGTTGGLS